jgi:hypothetical protein
MKFRGGEFSTGTMGNFQSELTTYRFSRLPGPDSTQTFLRPNETFEMCMLRCDRWRLHAVHLKMLVLED